MRLIPAVSKTIKNAKREIIVYAANSTVLILLFNLYMDNVFILYPILVSTVILLVYLIIKGISLSTFHKQLENAKLPFDTYCYDDTNAPVFETISEIHQKYLDRINQLNTQLNTHNTLFSQFIHGMKSSVSVIELACEKIVDSKLPNTSLYDKMI